MKNKPKVVPAAKSFDIVDPLQCGLAASGAKG